MFENIMKFLNKFNKKQSQSQPANSKDAAKERLHLVLMQDRANVSADFLELMKQEIIEVIKKYIDVDESAIDVRLTNKENEDGSNGAPALYANIPIINIKNEARKVEKQEEDEKTESNKEENIEQIKQEEKKQKTKQKEEKQEQEEKQEEKKEEPIIIEEESESVKVEDKEKEEHSKEKVKSEEE